MRVPYVVTKDFPKVDSSKILFADTETCGFYGRIRLLQLMQEGWNEVVMVEWPDPMLVAAFLSQHNVAWYNAHYDLTTVQQVTDTRFVPSQIEDLFLLARLYWPAKEKFSLDDALVYHLGYDPYAKQALNKKVLQKSDWSKPNISEDQYLYAATDVWYMPGLYEEIKGMSDDPNYKLDILTLRYCLDFQWNGMPVDKQRLWDLYEATQEKIDAIDMPINANSWQQVRPYIGEDDSDDLALATFAANGNERAGNVRTVRKLRKLLSFLDKFTTDDDTIYGKFKPTARSGRLTSNDQNLQQLPRKSKGVFGVGEDEVLIYADYAQLELRTICAITVCRKMEELFRDGEDLHAFTAEMLFGPEWTKPQRQLVKTYNFNLLYGGGVNMILGILLKQDFIVTKAQAEKDKKRWCNLWREIYAWQQKGISKWQRGQLSQTPMGRQYRGKMMTDQLNIENQGAGAEVSKLALHYMYQRRNEWADGVLCNFIHDSYIIRCPNDPEVYEPMSKLLAECMQEAWFEASKNFQIKDLPMPVNVIVGHNWGDIENDDIENIWELNLEPYAMLEKVNAHI